MFLSGCYYICRFALFSPEKILNDPECDGAVKRTVAGLLQQAMTKEDVASMAAHDDSHSFSKILNSVGSQEAAVQERIVKAVSPVAAVF